MSELNLTDEVASAKQELRAIKAQGLVTDPKDAVLSKTTNIVVSVPADNSDGSPGVKKIYFKGQTNSTPIIDTWLYGVDVPSNSLGFDEYSVAVQQTGDGEISVIVPYISSSAGSFTVGVHFTSLEVLEVWI